MPSLACTFFPLDGMWLQVGCNMTGLHEIQICSLRACTCAEAKDVLCVGQCAQPLLCCKDECLSSDTAE